METHKLIVLSTAHVSDSTRALLEKDGREDEFSPPLVNCYQKGDWGWFVHVPVEDDEDDAPEDMRAIYGFARSHGAAWLMFDCDAEPIDALPVFDWNAEQVEG